MTTDVKPNEPVLVPVKVREIVAVILIGSRRGLSARKISLIGTRFDVTANALRVALFRMVAAGEVTPDSRSYRATSRLSRASLGLSHTPTRFEPWNGQWQMIIAPPTTVEGSRLSQLYRAGFAEYCDGVWVCPSAQGIVEGTGGHFRVLPEEDGRCLAERLWRLGEWNGTAEWFRRQCESADVSDECTVGMSWPLQLAIGAHAHLNTAPRLPPELLPNDWLQPQLRIATDNLMDRLATTVARWRQVVR